MVARVLGVVAKVFPCDEDEMHFQTSQDLVLETLA